MIRRRRLKWKLLATAFAVLSLIAGGLYTAYKVRARSALRAAREQAFRAAERGDHDQAIRLMEAYLTGFRDDAAAVKQLALLLEKTAKMPSDRLRALHTLDRALQITPGDVETRRLAVEKAMELRRWKDAQDHLLILSQEFPQDAVIERQLGECAEGQGNTTEAAQHYDKAITMNPKEVEAYARLARLLRQKPDQADEADRLMSKLRQEAPDSVAARLALARYFRDTHRTKDGQADIEQALHLDRDSVEVRYEAALHEVALGHLQAAMEHVAAGLTRAPQHLPLLKLRVELDRRVQNAQNDDVREMIRRTVKLLEENPRKTADVLDLLIDVDELALARDILNGPQGQNLPDPLRDFLEARLKIAEEDYVRARDLLERSRGELRSVPTLARHAHFLLGICLRRLGDLNQAATSFRAALDISPSWSPALLELATTEAQRGQTAEALALFRRLMPRLPQVRVTVAQLLLEQTLKQPPMSRNWQPVEALLAESTPEDRKTVEWRLVRNHLLLAQGREAQAKEELESAIQGDPEELTPRLALASLYLQQSSFAQAEEILQAARHDIGDRVELRLSYANLYLLRDGPKAVRDVEQLADHLEKFSRLDQVRLLTGLYRVSQGIDRKLTRRIGHRLLKVQPNRADLRFGLLRLALADQDESAARQIVRELREVEGDHGAFWRCGEVALLLQFGSPNDRSWHAQARSWAIEASRQRPEWSLPLLFLAEIDEREGRIAEALQRFRSAIELGERSPLVIRRVVQMLNDGKRFDEAQELLRRLNEVAVGTDPQLARLTLPAMIGHETPEQIVARAKELSPESSPDYRDHLWLAQVLARVGGRAAEAEAAFRRAIRLQPHADDAWVAWVTFLASLPDRKKAEEAAAEARITLRGPEHAVALAVCFEAAGKSAEAENVLLEALKNQPDDLALQRQLAAIYWRRGDLEKAHPLLTRLSEGRGEIAGWARRHRAMGLARSGSYAKIREALPLIERNLEDAGATPEDQRARAILLSVQPGRRAEAVKALEASFRNLPATADEQMLLAQLYEASGNWPAARERLSALTTGDAEVRHLEYFIQRLLYHDELAAAELVLEKLERLASSEWGTIALKARIWAKTQREEDARLLIRQRVVGATDSQQILAAGRLLEEIGQWREAEQAYMRYRLRQGGTGAAAHWPLARFYALQSRLDEAIRLCEDACSDATPEMVAVVAAALARSPKLDPSSARRAEAWIRGVVAKHPQSSAALLALADFLEMQNHLSEAELLYERVLSQEPAHVVALNNLAFLLAWRGQTERALRLINAAIDQIGPQPALLDTRGVVQLQAGNHEAALADLQEAVALQQNPVRRFHLALAQQAAGLSAESDDNLRRAKELGLNELLLHPLERVRWQERRGS
jgi:tetratricopeptide (TPR) repeat protein